MKIKRRKFISIKLVNYMKVVYKMAYGLNKLEDKKMYTLYPT
jgi:hypothetical protein